MRQMLKNLKKMDDKNCNFISKLVTNAEKRPKPLVRIFWILIQYFLFNLFMN